MIPVLISTELARINHLNIGSIFDSRLVIESSTMEQDEDAFSTLNRIAAAYHRVYLPNKVAEEMFDLRVYGEAIAYQDINYEYDWKQDLFVDNLFVLADPMYQPDFTRAVANLEGNWEVQDLSSGFAEISASMANMGEIADFVLLGAVGATVLVISLVVLLFLRDRKHEIGVYLAMGHLMAVGLSQEMLRQDLLNDMSTSENDEQYNPLENLGYSFEISNEEMLATYEISLEPTTILMFYSIGLGTVLISTLIPIIFTVNVDPKKLLMENKT